MARLRTIKPEYWTDERVGECSVSARLLFIAAWNFADDHGGLDRSAKQLKAQAFPYDQVDCEPLIQELLHQGLLIEYEIGGKKYLHIKGFGTHQKVEKKGRPRVPVYEEKSSPPRVLTESSPSSSGSSLGSSSFGSGSERETRARVIDYGTGLTSVSAQQSDTLEEWRRSVPEVNQPAMTRWIVHCELLGKRMDAPQRLYQARELSKNGVHTAQDEVVDYCIGQGWKSLVPIGDVRKRRNGMSRDAGKPSKADTDAAEWDRLKLRASASGFRAPWSADSPATYETALRKHEQDTPAKAAHA